MTLAVSPIITRVYKYVMGGCTSIDASLGPIRTSFFFFEFLICFLQTLAINVVVQLFLKERQKLYRR